MVRWQKNAGGRRPPAPSPTSWQPTTTQRCRVIVSSAATVASADTTEAGRHRSAPCFLQKACYYSDSMEDFELKRVQKKLEDIEVEYKQLNHQILKTRQNEQVERDMLQRRYNGVIYRLEGRRTELEKEQKNYERQLERVEAQMKERKEKEEKEREEKNRGHSSSRRY